MVPTAFRHRVLVAMGCAAFGFAGCSGNPGSNSNTASPDGGGTNGHVEGGTEGGASSFPVEPTFNPGGYFNKDNMDIGEMDGCPDMPSATLSTPCRTWTFTPNVAADTANGEFFAGVFWQYGNQNWGTSPGAPIPAGYTAVTFWAKGAAGGEKVSFWVGGLKGMPHADAFQAPPAGANGAVPATALTGQWAQYTISLAGMDYSGGVLGGFAWSASYDVEAGAPPPIKFFLGGIQWQ
jgi:hypothetical protein